MKRRQPPGHIDTALVGIDALVQGAGTVDCRAVKALGLEVPPILLSRAGQVIERSFRSAARDKFAPSC